MQRKRKYRGSDPRDSSRRGGESAGGDQRWAVWVAGEQLAAEHLLANGYLIIARNLRIAGGELDIVAQDGDELVFVEVRSVTGPSDPLLSIDYPKQRQLRRLAQAYLQRLPTDCLARIDAIGVRFDSSGAILDHLIDAF